MKISYCTTCMGRAHHLKETLPQNIRNALRDASSVNELEFVVLNYSSKDDLHEWIMNDEEMKIYMDAGVLNYAHHEGKEHFHHAHAKNMAHRLATGDFVCNVDADNFLGEGFHAYIRNIFYYDPDAVIYPHVDNSELSEDERGYFGRIAMRTHNFYMLGGYDEARRSGWGGDDTDMVVRSVEVMMHVHHYSDPNHLQTIPHDRDERLGCLSKEAQLSSLEYLDHSLKGESHAAKLFNQVSFLVGHAQRNRDGLWGTGVVAYGQEQVPYELASASSLMSPCRRHVRGIANLFISRFDEKLKLTRQ